jgi:hypothetical protein
MMVNEAKLSFQSLLVVMILSPYIMVKVVSNGMVSMFDINAKTKKRLLKQSAF